MDKRRFGLGEKFILVVACFVVAFMVASFAVIRGMVGEYANDTADGIASLMLDQTERRLDDFVGELEHLARSYADLKIVKNVRADAMRDLFVSTVLERQSYLRAIYLGTVDGRMLEWGYGEGFSDYLPAIPPDYDPRTRPWYLDAIARGDLILSKPYRFASTDRYGITCAMPVLAENGSFVGVLGLDILLDDFHTMLEKLDIPRGGKAIVLAPGGVIVASQFEDAVSAGPPRGGLSERDYRRIVELDSGDFRGVASGREYLFFHRQTGRFKWKIAVGMPLEPMFLSMRTLLNTVSAIEIALTVFLVLAIAAVTGKLIVSPLGHIVSVINRLESGDKNARVDIKTHDEFGILGNEFNRLFGTVEEYSRELEEKVARRTEEAWRLQRENTQLRIMEERQRIYRDMHDSIGARLTNIFFANGVAKDLAKGGPARLRELLDRVEGNCLEAVRQLKEIILGMKRDETIGSDPSKLLVAGMRNRLKASGIGFECRVRGREAYNGLSQESRDEIEKVCEELVSNVLKHSKAAKVRFLLGGGKNGVILRFSDDGIGIGSRSRGRGATGLDNIQYRITRLGGAVDFESADGAGTRYVIEVPAGAEVKA